MVARMQLHFPYLHCHFQGARWDLAASLVPSMQRADAEVESQHGSEEELVGLWTIGRTASPVLLYLACLVRASLPGLEFPESLVRDSRTRVIGVVVPLGWNSSDELGCGLEEVGYCIATETRVPGSGRRWTGCDRLDLVGGQAAVVRAGEDSWMMAVEVVHAAVGLSHWP